MHIHISFSSTCIYSDCTPVVLLYNWYFRLSWERTVIYGGPAETRLTPTVKGLTAAVWRWEEPCVSTTCSHNWDCLEKRTLSRYQQLLECVRQWTMEHEGETGSGAEEGWGDFAPPARLPLNSKRLKSGHQRWLAKELGVSTAASVDELRQMIDGKLTEGG